jgi:hypothetical protein
MPAAFRVRIQDGSVIDLDREALRSWYEKGLVGPDTQVQAPGSRVWSRLAQATDVRQWRKPAAPAGRSVPARPSSSPRPASSSGTRRTASAPSRGGASIDLSSWLRYGLAAAVVLAVAGGLYATSDRWSPLIFGSPEEQRIKAAALPERRLVDETLGLTLELPRGFVLLRDGHGLFAPPANARLSLAEPRAQAIGYLAVDTPARGYVSLDAYLAQVMDERRRADATLREVRREDVPNGRRAVATRQPAEVPLEEVVTTWKDGWTYYSLVLWAPAADGRLAELSTTARAGLTTQGQHGVRVRQAVETVVREVPLLTPAIAETLMGQSEAQVLEPAEAFRRTYLLVGRGLPLLPKSEQKEMGALSSALYDVVPRTERARLGAYIERVRSGQATDPALDQQMSRVVRDAVLKLPAARRTRLQQVFERAVAAGIG